MEDTVVSLGGIFCIAFTALHASIFFSLGKEGQHGRARDKRKMWSELALLYSKASGMENNRVCVLSVAD
jgi:hypothetical protein